MCDDLFDPFAVDEQDENSKENIFLRRASLIDGDRPSKSSNRKQRRATLCALSTENVLQELHEVDSPSGSKKLRTSPENEKGLSHAAVQALEMDDGDSSWDRISADVFAMVSMQESETATGAAAAHPYSNANPTSYLHDTEPEDSFDIDSVDAVDCTTEKKKSDTEHIQALEFENCIQAQQIEELKNSLGKDRIEHGDEMRKLQREHKAEMKTFMKEKSEYEAQVSDMMSEMQLQMNSLQETAMQRIQALEMELMNEKQAHEKLRNEVTGLQSKARLSINRHSPLRSPVRSPIPTMRRQVGASASAVAASASTKVTEADTHVQRADSFTNNTEIIVDSITKDDMTSSCCSTISSSTITSDSSDGCKSDDVA